MWAQDSPALPRDIFLNCKQINIKKIRKGYDLVRKIKWENGSRSIEGEFEVKIE